MASSEGESGSQSDGSCCSHFSYCVRIQATVNDLHGWLEPYTHHPDDQLREMALDLRLSIKSRDPAWSKLPPAPESGVEKERENEAVINEPMYVFDFFFPTPLLPLLTFPITHIRSRPGRTPVCTNIHADTHLYL